MKNDEEPALEFGRVRESVTDPVPDQAGIATSAAGAICFYCGEAVHDPAVYWNGWTSDVYLHPDCAIGLAVRIIRDAHEIQHPAYYERFRSGPPPGQLPLK